MNKGVTRLGHRSVLGTFSVAVRMWGLMEKLLGYRFVSDDRGLGFLSPAATVTL